ncbi:MAG: hypothetical protein KKD35_08660, partial [Elusimicrobia bacterium]|nr:hypothetical protein [Elusimicrobiota bacterium]
MKGVNNGWDEVTKFVEDAKSKGGRNMLNKKILIGVVIAVVAVLIGASLFVVLQAPEKAPEETPAGDVYDVDLYFDDNPDLNTKTLSKTDTIVTFSITVNNTGEVTEDVEITIPQYPLGWSVTTTPSSITNLEAGGTRTVSLSVTPSVGTLTGEHSISITGTVKDRTESDTITAKVSISEVVTPEYGIDISCDNLTAIISPGKSHNYSLIIENTGSAKDTYNFSVEKVGSRAAEEWS